jgi:DNA segregation ATPase FtsK/SpoIIIE-like protein
MRNGKSAFPPQGFTPQNASQARVTVKSGRETTPSARAEMRGSAQEQARETMKGTTGKEASGKGTARQETAGKERARKENAALLAARFNEILGGAQKYRREISAGLLALCGVALLLALVSYDPADRANAQIAALQAEQTQSVATPKNAVKTSIPASALAQEEYVVKNWLGYLGSVIAHFMYNYTVGYAALAFPIVLFLWSAAIIREKISDKLLLGTSLAFVIAAITASFAGVLQLVSWTPPMRPEWSGAVGQFIARMLWQIIGSGGAFIVLTLCFIGVMILALDLNIERTIARIKARSERLNSAKSGKNSASAQNFGLGGEEGTNGVHSEETSDTTAVSEPPLGSKDYEDYHVSLPQSGLSQNGLSQSGDEILRARADAPSLADADEPARIIRRSAASPDIVSLRRDLIQKYSDDDGERASANPALSGADSSNADIAGMDISNADIIVAGDEIAERATPHKNEKREQPSAPTVAPTVLLESRGVVAPAVGQATISVSVPQTSVSAHGFSYPAKASITFVESKKESKRNKEASEHANDLSKKNDFDEHAAASAVIPALSLVPKPAQNLAENAGQNLAESADAQTQNNAEALAASRRNTEHFAGLVAGQVAEEVAHSVAGSVAGSVAAQVAAEIAERVAQEVLEKAKIAQTPEALTINDVSANVSANDAAYDAINSMASDAVKAASSVPLIVRHARPNGSAEAENAATQPNDEALSEEISYAPPTLALLVPQEEGGEISESELQENARILQEKLKTFRIEIENLQATPGPVVTQYEFVPASGVKVSQIENLSDDIALALKARGIRIIAPVPGRGTVAVEIPNARATAVRFSSIVDSAEFEDADLRLPLALGKTIHGDVFTADLAKMPHLLIAGATGSGKSVGINSIIASLLYKMHPRDLKFVIIDPKRVEMSQYRALAHHFLAVCPDIDEKIITDPQNAVIALKSVVAEMTRRYEVLQKVGQRNIVDYNQKVREGRYKDTSEYVHHEMPYIVVIVDELADLMMTSREVEEPICRLAQLARAVGIHLIVATQRPSVDVVTGLIKANFPARIAYQVASKIDSRTILDASGAEHLLGNGDMLFTPGGAGKPMRLQNSFLSTDEVERICEHISKQKGYSQPYMLPSVSEKSQRGGAASAEDDRDDLFLEAAQLVVRHQQCSTSLLQRRMKIGYGRAARIVDQLEEAGVIGAMDGARGRAVLVESEAALAAIV